MDRKKQPQAVFEYDVFLSFRGTDTRENFTDVLYHKMEECSLRVFRDNDKLQPGKKIDEILLAIKSSRICMPILSPSFASSKWCLREVAKMVELKKEIVPVFFGVTPDDVKLRPNSVYKNDLKKLKEKEGEAKVKPWEDALNQVARIKGFEWRNEGYTEFKEKLVKDLLIKLKPNRQLVPSHLVGIEDQINRAKILLDKKSSDVLFLGVHATSGSGKTTLAKVLFNELLSWKFDCCSFVADIRQTSKEHGRIEYLQKKLIRSLNPSVGDTTGIANPMQMIRKNFKKKKVLIVLDDVNQREQIADLVGKGEYFGPGSRIIVTTTNLSVLKIDHGPFQHVIKMEALRKREALELLSWHAFKETSPPREYESLANQVVSACGNLPLSLKVIGSLLYGKSRNVWGQTAKKLEKVPNQNVYEKLKISYDALEYEQQQMFLDIAMFFNKMDMLYPKYMWDACDFHPDLGLDALTSLNLVVVENGKLSMHDHLVALGRQIVHVEGLQHSKCSRYRDCDGGSLHVLKTKEGKVKIVGLRLDGPYPKSTGDDLVGLDNVRFLSLEEAKFGKKFNYPLPQLRWLSWHHFPSSFKTGNLHIQKLAILELPHSSISEKWSGWKDIEMKHLKVLDLTNCSGLTTTPDFTKMPRLERLILSQCAKLVELHDSIVSLKNLRFIDLSCCSSLSKLPEELGRLGKLEEVSLHDCTSLQKLPDSLGNLKSLLKLDISRKLNPLLRIIQLIELRAAGGVASWDEDMDLSIMTDFFEQHFLRQMVSFVKFLKDVIVGKMTFFQEASLPKTFGGLKALRKLDLSCTQIKHLPESFGNLENLRKLTARWSLLVALPKSIGKLKKLETLDVGFSLNLAEIPEEIGELSNLRVLNLIRTKISRLPSTVTQLHLLKSLNLTGCNNLKEAKKAPIHLKKKRAHAGSSKNQQSGAGSLEYQRAGAGTSKNQPAGAAGSSKNQPAVASSSKNRHASAGSLKKPWPLRCSHKGSTLPSSFDDCSRLEVLELCCLHLSNIPQLPSGLRQLALDQFHHKVKLPNAANLQNLRYLSVCCVIRGSTCDNLTCLPASLKELRVLYCDSLPDLRHLEKLQKLVVLGRDSLKQIRGLGKLGSLQELRISHCKSIQSLESLKALGKLKYLSIRKCPSLRGLEGLDKLSLVNKDVHLRVCPCPECSKEESGLLVKRELINWISEMGIPLSDLPKGVQQYLNTLDKASTGCLAKQVKKLLPKCKGA